MNINQKESMSKSGQLEIEVKLVTDTVISQLDELKDALSQFIVAVKAVGVVDQIKDHSQSPAESD